MRVSKKFVGRFKIGKAIDVPLPWPEKEVKRLVQPTMVVSGVDTKRGTITVEMKPRKKGKR